MILAIAFRNIFRQKRRTILTLLTMFGGFTLAVISIGWSDGSYDYIINMFTRNRLGHIQIHAAAYVAAPSLYDTVKDYAAVGEKASTVKGIQAWAPRLYCAGLASLGDRSAGARIIGIDPVREDRATHFDRKITAGRGLAAAPSHQVVLGTTLARMLKAQVGDQVVILSQAADGSMANDLYTVAGFAESGDAATDRTAFYLHIADAQQLLVLENQAHELILIVDTIARVQALARSVARELNDASLSVQPWQEFAKSFYEAMKIDQNGMWITLFIIVLIVAVSVLNTVLMSVLERRREYGLLKAIGIRPADIVVMVLCEVVMLALVSIALGTVAGCAVNYWLSIHGVTLPQKFTYGGMEFSVMYAEINARSIYIPAITVLVAATLVGFFPALRAAHTDPAKAMRTQ